MEVFICYETTTGLSYASNLKKALAKLDMSAFVANEDIQKGTIDRKVIDNAISASKYFVVVITMVSLWSDEVRREIELASKLGKHMPGNSNLKGGIIIGGGSGFEVVSFSKWRTTDVQVW